MSPHWSPTTTLSRTVLVLAVLVLVGGCVAPSGQPTSLTAGEESAMPTTTAAQEPTPTSERAAFNVSLSDHSLVAGRGRANLTVRAPESDAVVVSSPDLAPSAVTEFVNGSVVENGVRVEVPPDGRIPLTAAACHSGNVTFDVRATGSEASDSVSLTLANPLILNADFVDSFIETEHGETAAIEISLYCTTTVTFELRSQNGDGTVAAAELVDVDGDDRTEVRVDTGAETTGSLFAVGNESRLAGVSGSGPLPLNGSYEMALLVEGDENVLGTFTVTNASASDTAA